MKLIFISFCFLVGSFFLYAQNNELNYYDENWHECSKKDAVYAEKIKVLEWKDSKNINEPDIHRWDIEVYKNGELVRSGSYLSGYFHGTWKYYDKNRLFEISNYHIGKRHGLSQSYFPNGILKQSCYYDMGNPVGNMLEYYENNQLKLSTYYEDGKINGVQKSFYNSGELKTLLHYNMGSRIGNDTTLYKTGELLSLKEYPNDSVTIKSEYYKDGSVRSIDYRANGHKDSMFVYYPSGNLLIEEHYVKNTGEEIFYLENGEKFKIDYWINGDLSESKNLIDTTIIDTFNKNETTISTAKDEPIYTIVEEMPRFKSDSCENLTDYKSKERCAKEKLTEYLGTITFPEYTILHDIQTKCYIRFVINEDGNVEQIRIAKSTPAYSMNTEQAFRHIEAFPKWIPGMQRGKKVKVHYIIPISFKFN